MVATRQRSRLLSLATRRQGLEPTAPRRWSTDSAGPAVTINFFRPTAVPIVIEVTMEALPGYVSTTGAAIAQLLSEYVSGLGQRIRCVSVQASCAAEILGLNSTYNVTGIRLRRATSARLPPLTAILFNAGALDCPVASVTLAVS